MRKRIRNITAAALLSAVCLAACAGNNLPSITTNEIQEQESTDIIELTTFPIDEEPLPEAVPAVVLPEKITEGYKVNLSEEEVRHSLIVGGRVLSYSMGEPVYTDVWGEEDGEGYDYTYTAAETELYFYDPVTDTKKPIGGDKIIGGGFSFTPDHKGGAYCLYRKYVDENNPTEQTLIRIAANGSYREIPIPEEYRGNILGYFPLGEEIILTANEEYTMTEEDISELEKVRDDCVDPSFVAEGLFNPTRENAAVGDILNHTTYLRLDTTSGEYSVIYDTPFQYYSRYDGFENTVYDASTEEEVIFSYNATKGREKSVGVIIYRVGFAEPFRFEIYSSDAARYPIEFVVIPDGEIRVNYGDNSEDNSVKLRRTEDGYVMEEESVFYSQGVSTVSTDPVFYMVTNENGLSLSVIYQGEIVDIPVEIDGLTPVNFKHGNTGYNTDYSGYFLPFEEGFLFIDKSVIS